MQRNLIIVRHAKAKEITTGQADFDRKLSKRGVSDAHLIGQMLKELAIQPDKIYASPSRRTTMTANILAEELAYPADELIFDHEIYEASSNTLLNIVNNFDDHIKVAFLIGHNPGLTLLADYLSNANIEFIPTSGMVNLVFEMESWKMVSKDLGSLVWFKSPKMI